MAHGEESRMDPDPDEICKQLESLLLGDALDADEKIQLSEEILKIIYSES